MRGREPGPQVLEMIREIVEANARRSPVVAMLPDEDGVPSGATAIVRVDPETGDRVHLSR